MFQFLANDLSISMFAAYERNFDGIKENFVILGNVFHNNNISQSTQYVLGNSYPITATWNFQAKE